MVVLVIASFSALPVSAERELRIGDVVTHGELEATIIDFQDGRPVYQAIVTPNINTTASDGQVTSNGYAVYATARGLVNADNVYKVATTTNVKHSFAAGQYWINRPVFYFDTSSLSGFAVTAGTLNIYNIGKDDGDSESIQIQEGMPTYPHDPLVAGDYDLTNYAGNGGTKTINSFVYNAYNVVTLSAGGLAMINTSGMTKLMIRTTGDINNVAPAGKNTVSWYTAEQGGATIPYLVLTYTATAPVVISVAASNVATNTARLNSTITDSGGDPDCDIRFGYGTTTKIAANFLTYDTVTAWVSGYEQADNPLLDIAGLIAGTPYFFRVQIRNEHSTVTSVSEQTFTTEGGIADMTQFVGYPDVDNISLDWLKAVGADNTLIRYRTDTYPTTTADGTEVYNSTGTFYIHSGLTGGTTYYYSAWGESAGAFSANEINLVMTTSDDVIGEVLPTGTSPSSLFQSPDETFLANLQPFYSVINGLADTFGMPRGNAWLGLSLLFVMVCGLGLYIAFRAPALSLFVMALVMALLVTLHVLPSFMLVLVALLGLGGWATRPQGV